MFKRIAVTILLTAVTVVSFAIVTRAQEVRFALQAISPSGQKVACVTGGATNVLSALRDNGFAPKLDDTGFIYSLIGYDGPVSSDPEARTAFWSFWSAGHSLQFSDRGAAELEPRNGGNYIFEFGNGSTPVAFSSFEEICPIEPLITTPRPSNDVVPTIPPRTSEQLDYLNDSSVEYLLDNFSTQALANQDWGAIALGSVGRSVSTGSTAQSSVLSLSRNALAKAAQGADISALINAIKLSYGNGGLGEGDLVNDDIFGVLAIQAIDPDWLRSRQDILKNILNSQRANGSFGYARTGEGDVDMTAAAIWALTYAQAYPVEEINRAFTYINSARTEDGGYAFRPGASASIATTSWVLLAYRATGTAFPELENYLYAARQPDGSYLQAGRANYLNTAYAVLALSGKKLPVSRATVPLPIPSPVTKPAPSPVSTLTEVSTLHEVSSCYAHASATATAGAANAFASASATATCWQD